MSWLFASGCQGIGASASVLPMNIQGWFPLGMTGILDLLAVQGLSRVFSTTTVQKHHFFGAQPSLWSNSHIHTGLLRKSYLWPYEPLSAKWCLLFNTLSRFVVAFLPRSKCLLISCLKSPSTVILERKKIKPTTVSIFPHLFAMKWWDQMPWSQFCEYWVLSQLFHSPLSPSSTGSSDFKLVLTMNPGKPGEPRYPSRLEGTLT